LFKIVRLSTWKTRQGKQTANELFFTTYIDTHHRVYQHPKCTADRWRFLFVLQTRVSKLGITTVKYGTHAGYWNQRADERHGNPLPR